MDGLEKMIDGMCMTIRHDYGLEKREPRETDSFADSLSSGMTCKERMSLRASMRKLIEHNVAPVIEQLEREMAEARKDAERYQWLRANAIDCFETDFLEIVRAIPSHKSPNHADIDSAIDAAMKDKP